MPEPFSNSDQAVTKPHRALTAILEPGGITPVYQPIYAFDNGTKKLMAFECLSRGPKGSNFEAANVLFDYVRLKREETLVDRACVAAALASAPAPVRLALNVHASTLARDVDFIPFLVQAAKESRIQLGHLTVEIVEHAPPWDGAGYLKALDRLRDLGVRIALDDVGLGQSNFKMMIDVRPNYLKIDRYFIDGCNEDCNRQAVLQAIGALAVHFDAEIVAEGVEREVVIPTLRNGGIKLMQGFLFSRPLSAPDAKALVVAAA